MANSKVPKVVLFDIGGVCVLSPFAAILSYENLHSIPPGYINYTISGTAPDGAWQKAERGEIPLDDAFFDSFRGELEDPTRWTAYWNKILGEQEMGRKVVFPGGYERGTGVPPVVNIDAKEMFWDMMRMARSPDPYIYPALRKLRENGGFVVAALSNTILFPEGIRDEKGELFLSGIKKREVRALEAGGSVEEAGKGEGGGDEREDIKELFDVFISSAHVGMRKPEGMIYDFALEEVRRVGKERGVKVEAGDIVFLDDIGQNLRMARQRGFRTIKVSLGKSDVALRELEEVTGMSLGRESKGSKL